MAPQTEALLGSALTQLSERLRSDAERQTAFERSTNERFLAVHEDGRRDRREVLARVDKLGDDLGAAMREGFGLVERRFVQVCEERGGEHDDLRAGQKAIEARMDAYDVVAAERRGVRKVFGGAGKLLTWSLQNGWMLAFLVYAAIDKGGDVMAAVANATQPSAVTLSNALGPSAELSEADGLKGQIRR